MESLNVETSIKEVTCLACDHTEPIPYHCGRQMQIIDNQFVCWKGEHQPCCNSSSIIDLPIHHGQQMVVKQ